MADRIGQEHGRDASLLLCDHPPPRREMQKPRGRQYDVDGIHAPLPSVPIRAECNPVQKHMLGLVGLMAVR